MQGHDKLSLIITKGYHLMKFIIYQTI